MSHRRVPGPGPGPSTGGMPPPSTLRPPLPPRRRVDDVFIRLVWCENLMSELTTIRALLPQYPYITVHAEHGCVAGGDDDDDGRVAALPPGVRLDDLPSAARYALAKIDVDAFPVLQLGLTLCDEHGRLPVLRAPGGAAAASVWQVSLFPSRVCPGSGGTAVTTRSLAYALFASGVVSTATWGKVTWVAYGGLYHLGFLLKVLIGGAPLPDTSDGFVAALRAYLGGKVFDVRYVAARLPVDVSLKGPLAYLASLLGTPAAAAREPWQAGEKSLAACQVFMRIKGLYFAWDGIDMHAGCIHGLHTPPPQSS